MIQIPCPAKRGSYSITKVPAEAFNVAVDFSRIPITLVSITSTLLANNTNTSAAIIAASPAPAVAGSVVTFRIEGGLNGQVHLIGVLVSDATGEMFEMQITLTIVSGTGH